MRMPVLILDVHRAAKHDQAVVAVHIWHGVRLALEVVEADAMTAIADSRMQRAQRLGCDVLEDHETGHLHQDSQRTASPQSLIVGKRLRHNSAGWGGPDRRARRLISRSLNKPHGREIFMNFIIWLIIGGVVGWLASIIMRTDGQQGILLNVIVGIVGAFLGGLLISPLIGAGTINNSGLSVATFLVSLGGAVILLAIVNLFRRGRAR